MDQPNTTTPSSDHEHQHTNQSDGVQPPANQTESTADVLNFVAQLERDLNRLREASAEQATQIEQTRQIQAELEQREQTLLNAKQEIEDAQRQLGEQREQIEGREQKINQRIGEIEQEKTAIAAQVEELQQERNRLEAWKHQLEEQQRGMEADRHALNEERQRFEHERNEVNDRRTEIEARQSELNSQADQLSQDREQLNQAQSALEQERTALQERTGAIESEQQQIAQQRHELHQQAIEAEKQRASLDKRHREIEAEEQRLEESRAQCTEQLSQLERERTKFTQLKEQVQRDRERLQVDSDAFARQKMEALQTKSQATSVDTTELSAKCASLETQLSRRNSEIESLKSSLEEARKAAKGSASAASTANGDPATDEKLNEMKRELSQRDAAIETLSEHIRRLQRDLDSGAKEPGDGRPATEPQAAPSLTRRRERLRRQRRLLRARSRALTSGPSTSSSEPLSEDIASQQQLLVEVRDNLARAEKRMVQKWAHAATSIRMFIFLLILITLAAVSYGIALGFVPATYTAHATISAQARPGFPLTEEQSASWQQVHENMILADSVIVPAAERLAQQGRADLGTPEALREYLKASLVHQSVDDGTIHFSLLGEGSMETQRLLEAYTITFISVSNANRGKRTDGAKAKLSAPATVDPIPVKDDRALYAGVIYAGMLVLILPVGTGIYRRLRNVEYVIDPEGDLFEPIMSESDWKSTRDRVDGNAREHDLGS